jgi:hypothetical protein
VTSELNIWFALFDNPWVVVAILVASGVANWLAQRRAKKTEGEADPEAEAPPAAPGWQEKLRELLQEAQAQSQPTDPPKPPRGEGAPPVLRRTTPPEVVIVPPVITARESQPRPIRPPPVAVVAPSRFQGYAMDHVKSPPPARPARSVLPPVRKTGPRPGKLQQTLRRSDTARQAFVASLVFGPPKGLET